MPITPATLLDADPRTEAAAVAEIQKIIDWANAGSLLTDIVAGSLDHTHVHAAEVQGFPEQVVRSDTQRAYHRGEGLEGVDDTDPGSAGAAVYEYGGRAGRAREDRTTIHVRRLAQGETFRCVGMAGRVEVTEPFADVEVKAHFTAWTASDPITGPHYPSQVNPAGAPLDPQLGGRIAIFYKTVGTATEIRFGTEKHIVPGWYDVALGGATIARGRKGDVYGVTLLPEGVHDVFVAYVRDTAPDDLEQVIVSRRNFVVEVHNR